MHLDTKHLLIQSAPKNSSLHKTQVKQHDIMSKNMWKLSFDTWIKSETKFFLFKATTRNFVDLRAPMDKSGGEFTVITTKYNVKIKTI